jgi:WD40 repeat protein
MPKKAPARLLLGCPVGILLESNFQMLKWTFSFMLFVILLMPVGACDVISPRTPKGKIYNISVNPAGEKVVLTTSGGVWVYRFSDGANLISQEDEIPYQYQGIYSSIAWSPDGTSLAIGKPNIGVRVWDTHTWDLLTEMENEKTERRELPGFAWSPDGNQLALGVGNGKIAVWDRTVNVWNKLNNYAGNQIGITWTPDGKLLALGNAPHSGLYDVMTGEYVAALDTVIDGCCGWVSWAPNGKYAFVFFDLGGGVVDIEKNEEAGYGICCYPEIAWSQDGQYLAAVSEGDNEIQVWDSVSRKIVRQEKQGNKIEALAWLPTGELLAIGIRDGREVLWNTNTGGVLLKIQR